MTAELRGNFLQLLDVAFVPPDVQLVVDDFSNIEVNLILQLFHLCLHRCCGFPARAHRLLFL